MYFNLLNKFIYIKLNKRIKGFALVEISIALLILGIVTSITMTQMTAFVKLRREQVTRDNMEFVVKALGAYYLNKGGQLPKPDTSIVTDGFGIVPWRSLGVMDQYCKDGNGRPLLYKCNASVCGSNNSSISSGVFSDYMFGLGSGGSGFDIKNDRLMFIIKTVDGKHKLWYNEKIFTQVHCQGKTFRILQPTQSIKSKF